MRKPQCICGALVLFMVLLFGCLTANAASTVRYIGPYYYHTDRGDIRVGHFEVAGRTAFCIQHEKGSPPTGTGIKTRVYSNEKMRKALYCGYNGPKQWPGFRNMKHGVVFTSLLLSEYNPGSKYREGYYNFIPGMPTFRAYVERTKVPDIDLAFSRSKVKGYFSGELGAQRTSDVTVSGSADGALSLSVPEGLKLHNNATGKTHTGQVRLKSGDSFYFIRDKNEKGPDSATITGRNVMFQPVVYVTADTSVQDLSMLGVVNDTIRNAKLEIEWEDTGQMTLVKKSEDGRVSGIRFSFRDSSGRVFYHVTDQNGRISIDRLAEGEYTVSEEDVDSRYAAQPPKKVVVAEGKNAVVTFVNRLKTVDIKIKKLDSETGESVPGARFRITDESAEGKIGTASKDEDLHVSDMNGEVRLSGRLTAGHTYTVEEVDPPQGYMLNGSRQRVTAEGSDDIREVVFRNERQYVYFDIEKTGKQYVIERGRIISKKTPLSGAEFEIFAAEDIRVAGDVKYAKGTAVAVLTTDEDGKASTEGLPEGKYSVRETKAPDGYITDGETRTYDMTVPDDRREMRKRLSLSNSRHDTEFRIYKMDKSNMRKLGGARFLISSADGEELEIETDEKGVASLSGLPSGTYTYRETRAPEGYVIDRTEREFVIDPQDPELRETAVSVYNERKRTPPVTGDDRRLIFLIVFVMASGLLILIRGCGKLKA